MHLNQEDISLFFKLWFSLTYSLNCKYEIVPDFERPLYGNYVDKEPFFEIRKKLWENPSFIGEFLESDGAALPEEEKSILKSWQKNFINGKFIISKYTKKYTVFMSMNKNPKLYGVLGISDSFETSLDRVLPCKVETALLPFKGKIIYDSILIVSNVLFGPGVQRSFAESYKISKSNYGIIESLE